MSLESAVDTVVREWSILEDVEEQNKLPLTGEVKWIIPIEPLKSGSHQAPRRDLTRSASASAG